MRCLGRLDSAYCNNEQELRAKLLKVFELQMTVFPQFLVLDCVLCVEQRCRVGPTVRQLGLQRCRGLTDAVLRRLAAAGCQHLTQLILHSQDQEVTDEGMIALISQCSHLHAICLAMEVGSAALIALAEHCGPQLRHLCLEGVVVGEADGAVALAQHCRQLKSLALVDCFLGSVEAMAAVIAAQEGLTALSLDYLEIGDPVLQAVSRHHASLTSLSLFRATDFTPSAAAELLQRCAQLAELSVTPDSALIPDQALASLLDRQPTLRVTHLHAYPPYWREALSRSAFEYAF